MSSPDNVARTIAIASAAFTALNASISYANYKRVRPRLKLAWIASEFLDGELSVYVHVMNRGQTPISLIGQWTTCLRLLPPRHKLSEFGLKSVLNTVFLKIDPDCAQEVPALSGVYWTLRASLRDESSAAMAFRRATERTRMRLVVGLPNGTSVHVDGGHVTPFMMEYASAPHRQLSFDDLNDQ